MEELVQYRKNVKDNYGLIQLNRPEKRNAISQEMAQQLLEKVDIAKEDSIKFLVITGSGEMFCAGGDLNELNGNLNTEEAFSKLYLMKECLYELVSFHVPTICLLNGNALGGGCEIATACDFRIAKNETKFGFIQSKLGIVPGWGGGEILYEKVHSSFAYQWLVSGDIFDATYLEKQGWIHSIVETEKWGSLADILAPFLTKSIQQLKTLKGQYNKKLSVLSLSALMNEEVRNCANLWESPEHKEAVKRFAKL